MDSKIVSAGDKAQIRREALARRDAEPERAAKGGALLSRVEALPAYARARTLSVYVGVKSEVPTLPLIERALAAGKRVVVPVVAGPDLRLIRVDAVTELAPAPFGLLEPRPDVRERPERRVQPSEVDLFLVPGVAFDRKGGRLGYGKGFYDGLLARARAGTAAVALAFECQVVPEVPMGPRDRHIPTLVTEIAVYDFDGVRRPRQ
ncbi:MAG: 5-formyltetrahydrofolate cyclo-ligase [Gemmatimonadales bacterium]